MRLSMHNTDPLATIKMTAIMQNKDKPKFVELHMHNGGNPLLR